MEDCSLFQISISDDQINQWYPLRTSCSDPQNCGPTALTITSVMPREKAQKISEMVEIRGIELPYFTQLMLNYMPRNDITLAGPQPIRNITSLPKQNNGLRYLDCYENKLFEFIDTMLFNNNITIIGIERSSSRNTEGHPRHITTIAKNNNGDVMLFDGQYNKYYKNEQVAKYLQNYDFFYYWCTKIDLKRKFSDIINTLRKPKLENEQIQKKQKIGGNSIKKTKKYKKTKNDKKSKRDKKSKKTKRRNIYRH